VVAFFTDSVYQNEKMIKYSLIWLYLIGGFAIITFFLMAMKSYKSALELNK
jgi:hypothetical protein